MLPTLLSSKEQTVGSFLANFQRKTSHKGVLFDEIDTHLVDSVSTYLSIGKESTIEKNGWNETEYTQQH